MKYLLVAVMMAGTSAPEETTVWVFFSPDSPDASRILNQLKGQRVRTVLLVERYFGDREPAATFLSSIQAAGELRVVDDEGLKKARQLGIRQLPAVAVLRDGRAHVATGTQVDVRELLSCSK